MKEKDIKELKKIFEEANAAFLAKNKILFEIQISERTLCGALMLELRKRLDNTRFEDYFVDVEYNRNKGGKLKNLGKTIRRMDGQIIKVNCDLIVHSRGQNIYQDNLIALEMKKATGKEKDKLKDKNRLICLTQRPSHMDFTYTDNRNNVLPENVCGYGLGVYYEVDFGKGLIYIEYYREGGLDYRYELNI